MITQPLTATVLKSRFWSAFTCLFFLQNSVSIPDSTKKRCPKYMNIFLSFRIFSFKSKLTRLPSTFSLNIQQLHFLPIQNSIIFHFRKQRLFPQHKQFSVSEANYILLLPWLSDWRIIETPEILSPQWSTRSCGKNGFPGQPWCLFSPSSYWSMILAQSSLFLPWNLFSVLHSVKRLLAHRAGIENGWGKRDYRGQPSHLPPRHPSSRCWKCWSCISKFYERFKTLKWPKKVLPGLGFLFVFFRWLVCW